MNVIDFQEEEMEALRKNMQFEIDRLTAALADAEARMKVSKKAEPLKSNFGKNILYPLHEFKKKLKFVFCA